MGIIDRYIFREVARTWAAVALVLLLILISNSFARYLGYAAAGKLPGGAVLTLVGLASLKYLMIVIPVALFFAVMLAFGRLYQDSEMTAMRACGVASWDVYRPVMMISLILTIVLAVLSLEVSPWVASTTDRVRAQAKQKAEFTHFEAGRFKQIGGGGVFYAQKVSPDGRLLNVFAERHGNGHEEVVVAHSSQEVAAPKGEGQLIVLHDGYRYQGIPGHANYRIAQFRNYGIRVRPGGLGDESSDMDATPTSELWGQSTASARAEIEWRLVIPLSALILAFLAVPLARTQPRQGMYGKLFVAILAYISYQNILGVARVWVDRDIAPHAVGLWWVPAIAVLVAIILLWRQRELRRYSTATSS